MTDITAARDGAAELPDYDSDTWIEVPLDFPVAQLASAEDWADAITADALRATRTGDPLRARFRAAAIAIAHHTRGLASRRFWHFPLMAPTTSIVQFYGLPRADVTDDALLEFLGTHENRTTDPVVTELATARGERMIRVAFLVNDDSAASKTAAVIRVARLTDDMVNLFELKDDDIVTASRLVSDLEMLAESVGDAPHTAPAITERSDDAASATDWDALVARSGARPPQPAVAGDALRRVRRVLPRISGTTLDADISLALLTAASNGNLRERLTETQGRSARGVAAVKTARRAGTSDPVFSRASLVLALVWVVVFAIGVILSLRSVRTDNDYFVEDPQSASISSGVVLIIAALWFAGTELVRNPWAGSRAGGWGWAFYLVMIAGTSAAIGSVFFRIRDQSVHGAVGLGLTLQFVALALFTVALVGALRNREEATALAAEAAKTAPAQHLTKHDTQMRKETAWAVSKAAPGELDRDAAADGLRQLYEQGRLPAERTEAILRTLG